MSVEGLRLLVEKEKLLTLSVYQPAPDVVEFEFGLGAAVEVVLLCGNTCKAMMLPTVRRL